MKIKSKFNPPQYWEEVNRLVQEGRFLERYADFWGVESPEFRVISKADELGSIIHINDRRFNGEPYIYHPRRSALMLGTRLGIWGPYVTVGALLHDTVEDHKEELSCLDIELDFNLISSVIVAGLTKPEAMGFEGYPEAKSRAKVHKVKAAGTMAIVVKGYENDDNLLTLPDDKDFHQRQLHETERHILPLTRREPVLHADLKQTISLRRKYLKECL